MNVSGSWEIIKVTETKTDPVTYKVLARWAGGESRQSNSGIVSWTDVSDSYKFLGYSGSVYRCAETRRNND